MDDAICRQNGALFNEEKEKKKEKKEKEKKRMKQVWLPKKILSTDKMVCHSWEKMQAVKLV